MAVFFCSSSVFSQVEESKKEGKKTSLKNQNKIGIHNKFMGSGTQGSGLLYGWRYLNYNSEHFFLGGAGYTGQIYESSATAASFTYAGLIAGYDWHFGTSGKKLELSMLVGSASGRSTAKTGGGMLIEPTFSYVFSLGERTKTSLGVGYIYLPGSEDYRGYTVGFTFDILYKNL